jgi:hypothetical protein
MAENATTHFVDDPLIPSHDAAVRELHQAPLTLATWRSKGKGPKFVKIGRAVFYRASAIREWLAAQEHDPRERFSRENHKLISPPTMRHLQRGLSAREENAVVSKMIGKKTRRTKKSCSQAD